MLTRVIAQSETLTVAMSPMKHESFPVVMGLAGIGVFSCVFSVVFRAGARYRVPIQGNRPTRITRFCLFVFWGGRMWGPRHDLTLHSECELLSTVVAPRTKSTRFTHVLSATSALLDPFERGV